MGSPQKTIFTCWYPSPGRHFLMPTLSRWERDLAETFATNAAGNENAVFLSPTYDNFVALNPPLDLS